MDVPYIVADVDFSTVYGGLGVLRDRGSAFEGLISGLILPSLISIAHRLSVWGRKSQHGVADGQNKSFSLQNVFGFTLCPYFEEADHPNKSMVF